MYNDYLISDALDFGFYMYSSNEMVLIQNNYNHSREICFYPTWREDQHYLITANTVAIFRIKIKEVAL